MSNRSASSACSGVNEHPALTERSLDKGSWDGRSAGRLISREHDHINRHTEPVQGAPKSYRLDDRIVDLQLDDEHVNVGYRSVIATGARPKQDDLGALWDDRRQASDDLMRERISRHGLNLTVETNRV